MSSPYIPKESIPRALSLIFYIIGRSHYRAKVLALSSGATEAPCTSTFSPLSSGIMRVPAWKGSWQEQRNIEGTGRGLGTLPGLVSTPPGWLLSLYHWDEGVKGKARVRRLGRNSRVN